MNPERLDVPRLAGREEELEKLEKILESVAQGRGGTVFVSGEAGAGKTRLTNEFLLKAKQKGLVVLSGWCLSDAAVPYFPFVEALRGLSNVSEYDQSFGFDDSSNLGGISASSTLGAVSRDLSSFANSLNLGAKTVTTNISPQVWKDQLFAGIADFLHGASAQAPIILFIEDLHWADSASLALFHYLARTVKGSERVLLIATYRTEGLTTDSEGHMHPLLEEIRLMRREDLFTEVKLGALSTQNIIAIAESMLGGQIEASLIEKLKQESHGNSLFIVESIRMLKERQSIFLDKEKWRLTVDAIGIPSKIKDIILQRIALLKFSQRRVLDAASVIGEKFKIELLSAVLNQDILEVLETLNTIMHTTSLLLVEDECYRFDHARSREVLYEEIPVPLKRGYHTRIAEKLEASSSSTLSFSDLAYHYACAGNKEKSLKYSLEAGQYELVNFSNKQAIQHFAYFLQNIGTDKTEEKRIALEGLGDAYSASSMYDDAIKTFDKLAAQESGIHKLRAIRKATDAAFLKGNMPTLLLEYSKKAEELTEYSRLEMARVINNRSRAFGFAGQGNVLQDLQDTLSALRVFEEENSISDMGDALWRCGVVSTMYNDLREKGIGMLLRSIKIFRDQADVRKEILATFYAGVGFETCGLFNEGYQFFRRVIELGKNLDVFNELAQSYSRLSREADRLGNMKEAISLNRKALDYCRKTDAKWIEVIVCARIARQYLKINDLDQAIFFMKKLDTYNEEDKTHIGISEEINGARFSFQFANDEKTPFDAYFERFFEVLKKNNNFTSLEISLRTQYILCLEYRKRFEDSQKQREINLKILSQIETIYSQPKIQAFLVIPKEMQVNKEAELRLDFINVSRKSTMLKRIESLQVEEFKIIEPQNSVIQDGILELSNKPIEPFEVLTIKLRIIPLKSGNYQSYPTLIFEKESHDENTTISEPINFTVIEKPLDYEVLPGRRSIGYEQLDRLLLGGIPEKNSVIIAMPSSGERKMLTSSFLETGSRSKETTLLITSQLNDLENFVKDEQLSFAIVCNSQADLMLKNSQNVSKLKGIENLTNIDIAVTRFFRTLKLDNPRRACIDIISDVLLEHHALTSRKWLNGLLLNLKANGFVTLALIDPQMHTSEESQAVLSLFDGEISLVEKQSGRSMLKVKRLIGQKYLDEDLILQKR